MQPSVKPVIRPSLHSSAWLPHYVGFMPLAGCLYGAERMATNISNSFSPSLATSAKKVLLFPNVYVPNQEKILTALLESHAGHWAAPLLQRIGFYGAAFCIRP